MGNQGSYRSYQQFRNEFLNSGVGPLSSCVEDIADDMFRRQVANDDTENMWDSKDNDDE